MFCLFQIRTECYSSTGLGVFFSSVWLMFHTELFSQSVCLLCCVVCTQGRESTVDYLYSVRRSFQNWLESAWNDASICQTSWAAVEPIATSTRSIQWADDATGRLLHLPEVGALSLSLVATWSRLGRSVEVDCLQPASMLDAGENSLSRCFAMNGRDW